MLVVHDMYIVNNDVRNNVIESEQINIISLKEWFGYKLASFEVYQICK